MRRILQFAVLCLGAGVLSACTPDTVVETEDIPTAGIRFINAVPDTIGVDFRPVDIVENSTFYGVTFRSTTLLAYKNARAGSRHFRIFQSGTTPEIASVVVKDTTVNLEAGKRYTFILWGYARAGSSPARKLTILEDTPADPGANVAFRVVNATDAAVDARIYANGGTVPGDATWSAVAPLSATSYVTKAAGRTAVNIQPAGGGTAIINTECTQRGVAAAVDLEAVPGTEVAGSALSAVIVPRSVAGSTAPNITSPGLICIWDRRPPRAPGV
jgi:hypothetical protein